ncbi:MAG: type III pantothenate kinase [Bacteroidota bacterium]
MIVCIDSGNSRIKWGVLEAGAWLEQGALAHAEIGQLAALCQRWPQPTCLLLANVAGEASLLALRRVLQPWSGVIREVRSEACRGGVTNLYAHPAQLGVDRWCALIGARSLGTTARLAVMAGTATTVDSIDARGNFVGGLILPGIDLMRRALARDTAALPFADGHYVPLPRCTDDAIVTGCIEAQVGAIERAFARLGDKDACCVISGGNAELLACRLDIPYLLAHNLPLEGLRQLALET